MKRSHAEVPATKTVTCPKCDRLFRTRINQQEHFKDAHTAPCTCDHCGVKMSRKRLVQHIVTHTEPSFECEVCRKKFKAETYLKKHAAIHRNRERAYICPEEGCGKDFYNTLAITKHKRIHNIDDQFACTLCDSTFLTNVNLNKHLKLHETNQCPTCLVTFPYFRQLEIHLWAKGHKCKISEK